MQTATVKQQPHTDEHAGAAARTRAIRTSPHQGLDGAAKLFMTTRGQPLLLYWVSLKCIFWRFRGEMQHLSPHALITIPTGNTTFSPGKTENKGHNDFQAVESPSLAQFSVFLTLVFSLSAVAFSPPPFPVSLSLSLLAAVTAFLFSISHGGIQTPRTRQEAHFAAV